MRAAVTVLAASLLAACATQHSAEAPPAPAADLATAVPGLPLGPGLWPIDAKGHRTTGGAIYLHNLDARIDTLESRFAASATLDDREKLIAARWHRFRVVGHMDDAERALALVMDPDSALPTSGRGSFLQAVVFAGFHRFREAEHALQRAATLGHDAAEVTRQRNDLLVALGRYADLREDFDRSLEAVGDFDLLAHRADLRVLLGDLAGAERQYWAAQTLYRDINPVPLAWLHTQMGIALLRFGHTERAAEFFAAAVERLPGYYLAEEHLAECEFLLGRLNAARERYLRVIESTGQPEFMAALAEVEAARGDAQSSAAWRQRAAEGFRELVRRHGLAFAQHAAEFFAGIGETDEARRLARDNLALRQDVASWVLLGEVELAAGNTPAACEGLAGAAASGLRTPELTGLIEQLPDCVSQPAAAAPH